MTTRRPTSARSDQPRTHRSQSKPAKAQPILLDRLSAALQRQNVSLKRAALQSVAAAAFGFHNANEFAAADLVPPPATVLGRVSLPQGDMILVQDPAGAQPYGLPETVLSGDRAQAYGVSPYGGLVDLSAVTADPAAAVPVLPAAGQAPSDQTIHVALIEGWHGTTTLYAFSADGVKAQVAAHCRKHWDSASSDQPVASFASDQELITAFFDGHETDDLSYGEIPVSKLPLALSGPTAATTGTATVWVGVHDYDNGSTTYVDTTEAGLYAQVAKVLRESWSEVEKDAGPETDYPDDRDAVEAYFEHSDEDTLDVSEHALTASGAVAPAVDSDPDAAWRAYVAEVRARVEAEDAGEHWAQHPEHDTDAWQQAVMNGDTRDGYWEWLARTLEDETLDGDPGEDDETPVSPETLAANVAENVDRIKARNSGAHASPEIGEHPIYIREDWQTEDRMGLTTASYKDWVAAQAKAGRPIAQSWLSETKLDDATLRSIHAGRDGFLRIALEVPRGESTPLKLRPGHLVRITEIGPEDERYLTVSVAENVTVTFYPEDRGGYLPVSLATSGPQSQDLHPVYVYAYWEAERNRGARAIDYPAWVAEHERMNVLRLQNWSRVRDLSNDPFLRSTEPRCTIHVHGVAELVDSNGEPTGRTTTYAPGDQITLEEAEFMGSGADLKLETADGGRFTLIDQHGYLPVTPVRNATPISDAERALYPHAHWVSEMKATDGGASYAEWLAQRVRANTAKSQGWLRAEDLRGLPLDVRLTVHIHGRATIHDETGNTVRTDYAAGDIVTMAGIDDRDPANVSVTLVTHDSGLFALRASTRGGYLPISVVKAEQADPFPAWIAAVSRELAADVSPQAYKPYFDQGLTPTEAVAADRLADGIEEPGEPDSADAFLWKVAEELGRSDLTRDADFQEFCLNMHGDVTPAQAAESWQRR